MEDEGAPSGIPAFGALLKEHRLAAGISQEVLAERARMSTDGVSALERGHRRTPQRETVALLAGALSLDGEERQEFEAAAGRGRTRHPGFDERDDANGSHELPLPLTSFIGRETEMREIGSLIGTHRLVTLTGTGGIGKTQLSLRVGAARDQSAVRFVPLGAASQSSVIGAIASAVGVREVPNRPLADTLVASLKNRDLLLILDNCEHVVHEAANVANDVLSRCRHIRILATSREPLKVAGEHAYRVPSLGTQAAIALFTERARAANYRFALTDENVNVVADICRRLDGIALAIELAAARVDTLSLNTLRAKLDERFRVLAGADRTVLPRQQTMYAAIDWSYDLLSESERRLFDRLSIFVGGSTIEAAEKVLSDGALAESEIFDALSSLAEKSLIVPQDDGAQTRYCWLESMRAFASDKLKARGEFETFARRHAGWMAELADKASATALELPVEAWVRKFEPDLENARSAFSWALNASELSNAARIVCGFAGVWQINRGNEEPRRWIEILAPRIEEKSDATTAARLWYLLSTVTFGNASAEAAARSLALDGRDDEPEKIVVTLQQMTLGFLHTGHIEEAASANRRALEVCERADITTSRRYATALSLRAHIHSVKNQFEDARSDFGKALALMTALGEEHESNVIRIKMGEMEYRVGEFGRALECAEAALAGFRGVGAHYREATALVNCAAYRLTMRDLDGAFENARSALGLLGTASSAAVIAAIQHVATVAAIEGDSRRAARLRGYVDGWYLNEGLERDLTELRTYQMLITALGEHLSELEISALAHQGAQLSEAQAIEETMGVRQNGTQSR